MLEEENDMKKIFVIIVIATFCLIIGGTTDAADVGQSSTTVQKIQVPSAVKLFCPTGWVKKPNELVCVPSKPKALQCPKGYEYYEALQCAPYEQNGCKAKGCEIGCRIPPPR